MKNYIYALTVDSIPIYIGCTNNPAKRLYSHTHNKNARLRSSKAIMAVRDKVKIEVLDETDEQESAFWERHYISLYRSWNFTLLNRHQGGSAVGCFTADGVKWDSYPRV